MILASKHTDNLPEAIIRTTSLGGNKGDNNPASNTFVSTTTFDAVEFSESRRFQRKEIGICFWGGRPQRPQEAPQEAFPCQNRRGSLMAEAGSEEATVFATRFQPSDDALPMIRPLPHSGARQAAESA